MPFGQAASHSPWFVQVPKPSASICATMLPHAVGRAPAGPAAAAPRCETFAAVNSMAEAFGQAATHAPQPMHAAASMARSASSLRTGIALASGAPPVATETKPPAAMIRSKALRSTTRSRTTGNASARQGSIVSDVAVLERAHVQLAGGRASVAGRGACR